MALPDLNSLLRDGDALIVVPPFAGLDRPSLAAHVLQACAAAAGIRVDVLYANLLLGAQIGELNYQVSVMRPVVPYSASASSRRPPTAYPRLATTPTIFPTSKLLQKNGPTLKSR
jgi:hypothetical protein